jgi:16S rRNA (uracil1498-N3)-methyltransferase
MRAVGSRVPRFYFAGELRAGSSIELPAAAARHARVLRLRPGDAVVLFNGAGGEFAARLLARGRDAAEVLEWRDLERESPLAVTLVQGVSSGERMDLTVQKAVELGVAAVQPVLTRKGLVRLSESRRGAKLAHWRRVAIAACEQCGRNRVPEIRPPLALAAWCREPARSALRIMLSPGAGHTLEALATRALQSVDLAAGPEAGFDEGERALLERAGFVAMRLGPRVLRTETAALAALAALQAIAGDL